jgi:hypothetical protein
MDEIKRLNTELANLIKLYHNDYEKFNKYDCITSSRVCKLRQRLFDIHIHVIDMQKEYKKLVFDDIK